MKLDLSYSYDMILFLFAISIQLLILKTGGNHAPHIMTIETTIHYNFMDFKNYYILQ